MIHLYTKFQYKSDVSNWIAFHWLAAFICLYREYLAAVNSHIIAEIRQKWQILIFVYLKTVNLFQNLLQFKKFSNNHDTNRSWRPMHAWIICQAIDELHLICLLFPGEAIVHELGRIVLQADTNLKHFPLRREWCMQALFRWFPADNNSMRFKKKFYRNCSL